MTDVARINMSTELVTFLNARLDADMEDAELAYRFITARYDPHNDEAHNYFDLKLVDDAARISYTTNTALQKAKRPAAYAYTAGGWRTLARPASVARRIAKLDDDPRWGRALDVFANAALATLKDAPTITLVHGTDIVTRYNENRHCHCQRLGDLASSCMRYDGFAERFEMYADVAEMAVILCPLCNGTRARALVWTDVAGKKHIDRPYGAPVSQEHLDAWAKQQKMGKLWPNTNQKRKAVVVSVPRTDYKSGPYLDSLMFWCRTCHSLSNYECREKNHDKVLLRSTHAQGHTGWWGRCQECNHPFQDHARRCPNRRACGNCAHMHCAAKCPNGCWDCQACGVWMGKDDKTCRGGCVTCLQCGYVNTQTALLSQHGHCRQCADVIQPEVVKEVPLTWRERYERWEGTCPSCDYHFRVMPEGEPKPTAGMIECRYVHAGAQSMTAGHCPGCHAVMRWEVGDRPKGHVPAGAFSKTVHQPTMWVKSTSASGYTTSHTYDVRTNRIISDAEADWQRYVDDRRRE